MEIYETIEILTEEYIKAVLCHLFPDINNNRISGRSISLSPESFAIELKEGALLECNPSYVPKLNSFVHFTSLQNLHNILNERCIRMYNLINANDPKEVHHTLEDLCMEEKHIKQFKASTFCFSLCNPEILKNDNALNLWRFYGDGGGGAAIEFEFKNVNENFSNFMLANVLYNKLPLKNFFKANSEFESKHGRKVNLFDLFKLPSCLHKNAGYQIENEVRLLYISDLNLPPFLSFDKKYNIKYFFNKKNEIVSYYNLNLFSNSYNLPYVNIKRIQIGFKYDEYQFKQIQEHLNNVIFGYMETYNQRAEIDIEHSPLKNIYN